MGRGGEMKITVMGVLIVFAVALLLGLVVFAVGQNNDQTGKNDEQQPINPS
jgi:Na+-transporting methylmalonyl-CoA/oxaloacetate decarboxylase gamma subunit